MSVIFILFAVTVPANDALPRLSNVIVGVLLVVVTCDVVPSGFVTVLVVVVSLPIVNLPSWPRTRPMSVPVAVLIVLVCSLSV